MKRKFVPIFGFLLLSISICNLAHAQFEDSHQPYWYAPTKFGTTGLYNLFGTDTVGPRGFSLGVYADFSRFALPVDPRDPELFELRFVGTLGLTERLEIGGSFPYVNLSADEEFGFPEIDESGAGDLTLMGKFRFVDNPGIGVFGLLSFPTGDEEKGLGSGSTDFTIGGIITKRAGTLNLYGNVAFFFSGEDDTVTANCFVPPILAAGICTQDTFENALLYGGGIEVTLARSETSRFAIFGEINAFSELRDEDDEKESPLDEVDDGSQGTVGVRIGFSNGLAFTGGWAGQISGKEPVPDAPVWRVFGGITYTFAAKPTPIPTPTPEPTPTPTPPPVETPPPPVNRCPEITAMTANPDRVTGGESVQVTVEATDPDGDALSYQWTATGGQIEGTGSQVTWVAPTCQELGAPSQVFSISVTVSDGECPVTRAVTVEVVCERILEGTVNFPRGARLDNIAKAILDNIAISLQQFPDQAIVIEGHTDSRGNEEANFRLGLRRAEAVRDYLVTRHGIDPNRITVESFGSQRPIADNATEEGRRQNRRVEIYRVPFK